MNRKQDSIVANIERTKKSKGTRTTIKFATKFNFQNQGSQSPSPRNRSQKKFTTRFIQSPTNKNEEKKENQQFVFLSSLKVLNSSDKKVEQVETQENNIPEKPRVTFEPEPEKMPKFLVNNHITKKSKRYQCPEQQKYENFQFFDTRLSIASESSNEETVQLKLDVQYDSDDFDETKSPNSENYLVDYFIHNSENRLKSLEKQLYEIQNLFLFKTTEIQHKLNKTMKFFEGENQDNIEENI